MKIPEFRPATEADFPTIQDKTFFEVLAPVQKAVKDLVKLTQKFIGSENINEAVIQIDLIPDVWTTVEITTLRGPPVGIFPILVDYEGQMSKWGARIIDSTHFKVKITVDPAITTALQTRIWVKGS